MTDDELLRIVRSERLRAIGFEDDESLRADREKALNYRKGVMPDVPSLPNRSQAVSMDVADAVETILPDLLDIFTGGDDVASFQPTPKAVDPQAIEEAERRAQQETDYVNHVVFEENPGFMVFNSMFKDALEVKTGVVKWWWEEADEAEPEEFEGKTQLEVQLALQDGGELLELTPSDADDQDGGEPLYSFKLAAPKTDGCVKLMAVAPEDFSVAPDTIRLKDAPYCAHRSRPRAQDLILRGIDEDLVERLPAYSSAEDSMELARDTAGEHDNPTTNEALKALRQVEVIEHYIRLVEKGKPCIWRVLTGKDESILLEKEQVSEIQFAAITPFVITHRFYGESVADKVMEIQKIKTVLQRMMLDSGYFALNARNEVDMTRANEFTISDLLRNEPAMPVRTNGTGVVTPIQSGALNFDVMGAIEYMSTVSEARTGIVRNAQGLNPDTLHDTAKGAMALMANAQRRTRMIARVFAEMGVKDIFLGVHALLRRHSSQAAIKKLRGSWVSISPSEWSERNDMTIEVGLGAAGVDHEVMSFQALMPVYQEIIAAQGGMSGPLVTAENVYELTKRFMGSGLKMKGPERYISDPAQAPPQPPKPDPEMEKVKGQLAISQQEGAAKLQQSAAEGEQKAQLADAQAVRSHELAVAQLDAEMALKREQIAAELQLKREQLVAEIQLKRELGLAQAAVAHETGMAKVNASVSTSQVEPGGEPG